MIKITVTPRGRENLYALLVKKERSLRDNGQGTLHRKGQRTKGEAKWVHKSYNGWIRLQECLGGIAVALVQARNPDDEWQLLRSFIGFLDRHFREEISGIGINYETE
jgi:hypothetical protein